MEGREGEREGGRGGERKRGLWRKEEERGEKIRKVN